MEGVEKGERLHEGIEGGMVVNMAGGWRLSQAMHGRPAGPGGGGQGRNAGDTCAMDLPP